MPQAEPSVRGRVYVAHEGAQVFTTAKVLMELNVPTASYIEILRCWVAPAEGASLDEVLPICLYTNNAAMSGGTVKFERFIQGDVADNAASDVVASKDGTVGATPDDIYCDAFHLKRGWLYLPAPDERIKVAGHSGGSINFFGMRLPSAPEVSTTLAFGMNWKEVN